MSLKIDRQLHTNNTLFLWMDAGTINTCLMDYEITKVNEALKCTASLSYMKEIAFYVIVVQCLMSVPLK